MAEDLATERRANWRRIHICGDFYWGHSSFSAEDNWLQSVKGQKWHLEAGNTNFYLSAVKLCWETTFPIMQFQSWYSPFWGIWFHDTSKWWRHKKLQWTLPSWSAPFMLLLGCICISITLVSVLFPLPSTFMLGSIIYQQEWILFSCYNSCTSLPTLCCSRLWMVWQLVHDVHILHNSSLADVRQASHNKQSSCNSYKEYFWALKFDCLTANLLHLCLTEFWPTPHSFKQLPGSLGVSASCRIIPVGSSKVQESFIGLN